MMAMTSADGEAVGMAVADAVRDGSRAVDRIAGVRVSSEDGMRERAFRQELDDAKVEAPSRNYMEDASG
jgi:hypothetical protein